MALLLTTLGFCAFYLLWLLVKSSATGKPVKYVPKPAKPKRSHTPTISPFGINWIR